LRQITGEAHFNEVFFDDARIPATNLVGDLNDGWRVARTTLMNERFATGSLGSSSTAFDALRDLVSSLGAAGDPTVRQGLARVYTLGRLFDLTNARVRTTLARGGIPGVEGSILKLAIAQLGTAVADLGVDVAGAGGMLVGEGAIEAGRWPEALLGSFAMHIGGGTDEVQRNIVGELVLGLPREPDASRELPYCDLKRA
jgi:alkylation response protein AidB-like acyl-CoA dehydrogenase